MEKKGLSKLLKIIKKNDKKNEKKEDKQEEKKQVKKVTNDKEIKKKINKETYFRQNINFILDGKYRNNLSWVNVIDKYPNWDKKPDDEKKIILFKETIKKLENWERVIFQNKFESLPKNMILDFMNYYIEQIQKDEEKDYNERKGVSYRDVLNNWMKTDKVKQITEEYKNISGNIHTFESLDNIGKKELLQFVEDKKIPIIYPESYKKEFNNNLTPSLLNYHALIYQISRNIIKNELETYRESLIKLSNLKSEELINLYNRLNKSPEIKNEPSLVEIIKYIKDYMIKEKIVKPQTKKYKLKLSELSQKKITDLYYKEFTDKKVSLDNCNKCNDFFVKYDIDKTTIDKTELDKLIIKHGDPATMDDCYQLIVIDKCHENINTIDTMISEIINKKINNFIYTNNKEKEIIDILNLQTPEKLKQKYWKIVAENTKPEEDVIQNAIDFLLDVKKKKMMTKKMEELNKKGIGKLRDIAIKNKIDTDENINNMLYYDLIKQILKKQPRAAQSWPRWSNNTQVNKNKIKNKNKTIQQQPRAAVVGPDGVGEAKIEQARAPHPKDEVACLVPDVLACRV